MSFRACYAVGVAVFVQNAQNVAAASSPMATPISTVAAVGGFGLLLLGAALGTALMPTEVGEA